MSYHDHDSLIHKNGNGRKACFLCISVDSCLSVFCLIAGMLLYIPLRWWAKRNFRDAPSENEYKLHVTSAVFACIALMIFALLIGFTQEVFSPETVFGRFIRTLPGKFYYLITVFLLTVVVGLILWKPGFTPFIHPDNEKQFGINTCHQAGQYARENRPRKCKPERSMEFIIDSK